MTSTTAMFDGDDLRALHELTDDLYESIVGPQLHTQQVSLGFNADHWRLLHESGLTLLTTPEASGGSGAGVHESAVALEQSGYYALPAPIGEHDVLASWSLRNAEMPVTAAPLTALSTGVRGGTVTARSVPWAMVTEGLVAVGPGYVAYTPAERLRLSAADEISGESRADVEFDLADSEVQATPDLRAEFQLRGALLRSMQMCGAADRCLSLAVEHARGRLQFGRPIGKFQAVQHLVAEAAGLSAAAKAATSYAVDVVARGGYRSEAAEVAIAAAKIQAGAAAVGAARNAHQVHGAIGFTLDHRLRHYSTRCLAWNRDFLSPPEWKRRLGMAVLDSDRGLWSYVTAL